MTDSCLERIQLAIIEIKVEEFSFQNFYANTVLKRIKKLLIYNTHYVQGLFLLLL